MVTDGTAKAALVFGGVGVFLGALLHIGALIGGPEWIAFVGAPPSVVRSAQEGTWLAPVGALAIAALLMVWSLYAFSAAGLWRPLPGSPFVLGAVAAILFLRSVVILPILWHADVTTFHGAYHVGAWVFIFALAFAYSLGLRAAIRAQRAR